MPESLIFQSLNKRKVNNLKNLFSPERDPQDNA